MPCFQVGLEVGRIEGAGGGGWRALPALLALDGPGSADIRRARSGSRREWGRLVVGDEASAAGLGVRGLLPKRDCPLPKKKKIRPSQGLLREAQPAPCTFPAPPGTQGLVGLQSELSLRQGRGAGGGRGSGGGGGWEGSRPRPLQLLASARTSQVARLGCNLGKFFRFLFSFFFKLSLLSLLRATWWCAGGGSLPPSSRPSPLPLSSLRPPLPSPAEGAGRLRARSPLTTYGMTSERENVPRPEERARVLPAGSKLTAGAAARARGRAGWFQHCKQGVAEEDWEKKKEGKNPKWLLAVCGMCLSGLCRALAPQCSRARSLAPALHLPAPAPPPAPAPAFTPPAERGEAASEPPPRTPRGRPVLGALSALGPGVARGEVLGDTRSAGGRQGPRWGWGEREALEA